MKSLLWFLCAFVTLFGGIIFSIWIMLIGGIIQLIGGCCADPISANAIAYGITRIIFAYPIISLSAQIARYTSDCAEEQYE